MPTEKEYMLKQADAEATYQKKLTAGQNITINPVTNEISSSGGGSNVEYTSNFATGETLGLISINGEVTPIKTPNLISGTNITIETDVTTGAKTISSTASGGSTITPNPTGTPTDTMNTVEVDGVIYNLPSGGGGASAIEKTISEYKALTPEQKKNGSIYMVQGSGSSENSFDMTQGSAYKQDSMSFTASETNIESFWNGGTTIGGDWRTIAIDVTDLITIKFNIQTTTCYGHNNSNVEEQTNARFINTVYLFTSLPSGWACDSENQAIDYLKFKYTNTNYGEQEFDVSELTGSLYIVWASSGWNAIMSNLTFVSKSSDNKIFFMNTEYANTNGGSGGSNVSITSSLPRGTKIADYSIDGESNELLAPIVNILQEDYDALPSTKNSDGIAYFITATKELDSNYTYHKYGENDEIVVRVYHEGETDEEIIWFFNGFTKTASDWSIPSELQPYTPDVSTLGSTTSKAYDASDSDTQTGWIGWSQSRGRDVIRSWNIGWDMTLEGTFYAVVRTDRGDEQTNPYEDPYIWVESTSRKIMLNGRAFVNGGGGSSVIPNPTDSATDTLNTIEIDGTVYDIEGGGGSANLIDLTQEEYNSLPISERTNGSAYFINEQESGGTTTRQLSVTFANAELKWEVGENFLSAEGQTTHDSRYGCKVEVVDSTTIRYTRTFNGSPQRWYTGNYYDGQYITFTADFVTTYMGTSTVNFECVYDIPAYKGTKIYHNDIEFKNTGVNELTQTEYDNLPLAKRQNGSIYMTHDDDYKFISYNNDQIVVRVNTNTGETLWFFNGWVKSTTADVDIPAELISYLPDHTTSTQVIQAKAWTDSTSTTTNGWVGFVYPGTSSVKLRAWSTNFRSLISGTFWAVLDINGSSAEGGQTAPYSAPTEGLSLLPNRIYYNNTLYADNATRGGGSGGNTITYGTTAPSAPANDGDTYFMLDANNQRQATYLYITNAWVQIEGAGGGGGTTPSEEAYSRIIYNTSSDIGVEGEVTNE